MSQRTERTFSHKPAIREKVPLLVGLYGPSGGGKTMSALELAIGMQSVIGGDIYGIDTESKRMKHYADQYKFIWTEFTPPFGSLDYLDCINSCRTAGASIIIIDSMSHEHEGDGGLLDQHEAELQRMAGDNYEKRERCKMLAWAKPKRSRRELLNSILQMDCFFIFCFRAGDSSKPVKKEGKTVVERQGFVPIAGQEFVFEMTASVFLPPRAEGIPQWGSDYHGESLGMKLPQQFRGILDNGKPLSRDHGKAMATWALGYNSKDSDSLIEKYGKVTTKGEFDALEVERKKLWKSAPDADKARLKSASDAATTRL